MQDKSKYTAVIPEKDRIPDELFSAIQDVIPIVCIDLGIFRRVDNQLQTLLIKRRIYPSEGSWCLLGGRILKNEYIRDAIERQAKRELGVSLEILKPWDAHHPVKVFDEPTNDPQKHAIVMMYPAVIADGELNIDGPEFSEMQWFDVAQLPETGFTHKEQIDYAAEAINRYDSL